MNNPAREPIDPQAGAFAFRLLAFQFRDVSGVADLLIGGALHSGDLFADGQGRHARSTFWL